MAGGADPEFWLPFRGEGAPSLEGFAGVLAFGGQVNPDEDEEHPWLSEVRDFVAGVVERGVPYLGVCPAGQLLAQASGEVVNEAIVNYFEALVAAGGFFEGATDQTLSTLRVVR